MHRKVTLPRPGLMSAGFAVAIAVAGSLQAPDAVIVPLCGGLILALGALPNARAGWLASKPAVYLGEISYSVYMVVVPWKLLAVNAASKLTGGGDKLQLFVWLAVFLMLPVVAAVSYHLVEFPARRALRGIAQRRAERAKARAGDPQLA